MLCLAINMLLKKLRPQNVYCGHRKGVTFIEKSFYVQPVSLYDLPSPVLISTYALRMTNFNSSFLKLKCLFDIWYYKYKKNEAWKHTNYSLLF